MVAGTAHASEVALGAEVPEIRNAMLDGIASLAKSV